MLLLCCCCAVFQTLLLLSRKCELLACSSERLLLNERTHGQCYWCVVLLHVGNEAPPRQGAAELANN